MKILAGHQQWHLSFCPVLWMLRTPSVQLVSIANLPRAFRPDGWSADSSGHGSLFPCLLLFLSSLSRPPEKKGEEARPGNLEP